MNLQDANKLPKVPGMELQTLAEWQADQKGKPVITPLQAAQQAMTSARTERLLRQLEIAEGVFMVPARRHDDR